MKLIPYAAVAIIRFKDEDGHTSTIIQPLPLLAENDAHAVEIGREAVKIMAPSAYQVDVGAVAFPEQLLEQLRKNETDFGNQRPDEEGIDGLPEGSSQEEVCGNEHRILPSGPILEEQV